MICKDPRSLVPLISLSLPSLPSFFSPSLLPPAKVQTRSSMFALPGVLKSFQGTVSVPTSNPSQLPSVIKCRLGRDMASPSDSFLCPFPWGLGSEVVSLAQTPIAVIDESHHFDISVQWSPPKKFQVPVSQDKEVDRDL